MEWVLTIVVLASNVGNPQFSPAVAIHSQAYATKDLCDKARKATLSELAGPTQITTLASCTQTR
jgi:hypothetical protein